MSRVYKVFPLTYLHWYCSIGTYVLWVASLASTVFILSMTFDRFIAIIMPHKAASFNTITRANITIIITIAISVVFNLPYVYSVTNSGITCVLDTSKKLAMYFWWVTNVVQYMIPFLSLISMNSIIIHKLRMRSKHGLKQEVKVGHDEGQQNKGQGQSSSMRTTDRQTYIMLLFVAFSFLILITPFYLFNAYVSAVDYLSNPKYYAGFHLFYQIMQKMYYTNNGINFLLYVVSGKKFRTDLLTLFQCNSSKSKSVDSSRSINGSTRY